MRPLLTSKNATGVLVESDLKGMVTLKQRVITGVALVAALIIILVLGTPFVEFAIALLACVAVVELFHTVKLSDNKLILTASVIGTVGIIAVQCFGAQFFNPVMYAYIVALFLIYMVNMQRITFGEISKTFFVTIYVSFMFAHIILVRNMDDGNFLIWFVLIGAFVTDTAALFAGKFFGRHKLCPRLSPKKTMEGAVGGILGCIAITLFFCLIFQLGFDYRVNYLWAIFVSFDCLYDGYRASSLSCGFSCHSVSVSSFLTR